MSELVLLRHNEPMTTSLAIAEGTENTHESVIKLVRKYVEDLQEFGTFGFEIQKSGGRPTEVAFLNEPQATLLITFLRNSEIVVRFKVALVKAFFEMRDRLRGQPGPQFVTSNLSHGADLAVAADRTFRSFLRAARSAGLALPQALRTANRQTVARTGMDMLAELGVDPETMVKPPPLMVASGSESFGVASFAAAWLAGRLPVPCCICKSTDLYAAYRRWCIDAGMGDAAPENRFHHILEAHRLGIRKTRLHWEEAGRPRCMRSVIPPAGMAGCPEGQRGKFYAAAHRTFAQALEKWT